MQPQLLIEYLPTTSLIPYAKNARIHSKEQIQQIGNSIKEFGFINPVVIDGDLNIIAGHGRVMAAQKIRLAKVPTIDVSHLTPEQKRLYILADNKIAENAAWDEKILALEVSELTELHDADMGLAGFSSDEIQALNSDDFEDQDGLYSRKIIPPVYEPSEHDYTAADLYDNTKTLELQAIIEQSKLSKEVKFFLNKAAERHTVFDFQKIADYYATADKPTQALMEQSALVIIDLNQAIDAGFVTLSENIALMAGRVG